MDRPFLTYDKQISRLKNKYHLIIEDEKFAKEVLASLSYYDLINGYQSIYMKNDEYIDGTTIEQLALTHIFNKNIQGVLLKYSTYVENSFKTLLSHVIADSFSEHQDVYLDISNYKYSPKSERRQNLRDLLYKLKKTCIECEDTPTKHYRDTKNHIPPWILFRNISFSNATNLFTHLKNDEKEDFFSLHHYLSKDSLTFQNKMNIAFTSLTLVRKFRNVMAHNLNFLSYRECCLDKEINTLFIDTLIKENEVDKARNDIWGLVVAIALLLNSQYLTLNFLSEFNAFMKSGSDFIPIYCGFAGIPMDYEKRITKYLNTQDLL